MTIKDYSILLICVVFLQCNANLNATILTLFSKQVGVPQPLPISFNAPRETRVALTKAMSKNDVSLEWIDQFTFKEKFLLVLYQDGKLFASGEESTYIDQQIFYLTTNLDLYEKYTINNELVQQKLGNFDENLYRPLESVEQNYLKRRQNFHGSTFIAMAEDELPAIAIENLSTAPYHSSNQTYEVTKLVRGAFFDVWKLLEIQLNFTTKLYKRKDGKWGVPSLLPNGTAVLTEGIIKSIVTGQADIAIANIGIVYNRQLVIDYIHPIVDLMIGIFVNKDGLHETFDFLVYRRPLNMETWIVVLISFAMIFAYIALSRKILGQGLEVSFTSSKAYLINETPGPSRNHFLSLKIIFFTVLLMGNVLWMAFNGSLLSGLITPTTFKPFHNLETLLESNYRLKKLLVTIG